MTWLPCPLFFAIFGFVVALVTAAFVAMVAVWWLCHAARRAVNAAWVWRYGFRRPTSPQPRSWIPAAPTPLKPQPHRLTERHIRAEARRIETELLNEFGEDFARILGLFADDPHTTDR